jgi:ribosomal protein S18 acetylase RimI-like enzyme
MEIAATVREAQPEDAAAFSACHYACWQEAYSELWDESRFAQLDQAELAEVRRREIESGRFNHWLAEVDGQVVGIAMSGPAADADSPTELELYAIYVREAYYGTGIATKLLTAATGTEPVSLWVYRDNPRASAFYVNQGFIPDGADRVDPLGILELRFVRN